MTKPIAVLISDIHFSPNTLELACASLRQALDRARQTDTRLIIAGDLLDTKAIMRAECVNAILGILDQSSVPVYIMVGNHDRINEKSLDTALWCLDYLPCLHVINTPVSVGNLLLMPYISDVEDWKARLKMYPDHKIVIAHQGFKGAKMGHYIVDKSSIDPETVKDYCIWSGHYHARQTLGTVSYIGNPYTLTFGEANDPPKGFQVLFSDGSAEFVPTNLRKHVVIEMDWDVNWVWNAPETINPQDLVWVKAKGPKSELAKLSKESLSKGLGINHLNFKLDKTPTDPTDKSLSYTAKSNPELLNELINKLEETESYKTYLKKLWKGLYEA